MDSNNKEEQNQAPEEIGLETDSSTVRTTAPEHLPEAIVQNEKKTMSIGRLVLIGLALVVVSFVAGYIVEYFTAVRPRIVELRQLAEQSQTNYTELENHANDLQTQVEDLQSKNETLTNNNQALTDLNDALTGQTKLDSLHVSLLMSLYDVSSARLALERGDTASARLALTNTDAVLDDVKSRMAPETQQVITDIQTTLAEALSKIDQPSAQDDLQELENQLKTIENSLFLTP